MSDLSKAPRQQPPAARPPGTSRPDADRTPLNWLLLVPILLCLAVGLYNRTEPTLFGMPFFYWFQLAIIPVGVVCTIAVYRAHARGKAGR